MTEYCLHHVNKQTGIAMTHSFCGEKLNDKKECHKHGKQISCGSVNCFNFDTNKVNCKSDNCEYKNNLHTF